MGNRMSECNHRSRSGVVWKAGDFCWELDSKALIMGILNITPDSFSDGGRFQSVGEIVEGARGLVEEGVDILDIGGESTRPGAASVSLDEELGRVVPVIESLRDAVKVALSIDTCKPDVAAAALIAGAHIVNDISGLRDERMVEVCAGSNCGVVVMHMKGTPSTMQGLASYDDVVAEVRDYFEERFNTLTQAGIAPDRLVFDPGIGFGKTLEHNLALLNGVPEYIVHRRPVLMGLSRKSFIGALLNDPDMSRREAATQALTALTRSKGAMIHRVHQVHENLQVVRMLEAVL
jgi:dihydropteroate synthase